MNNVPDIIEALGGNAKLAEILGTNRSTVSEMRRRGSIPVEHWPAMILAAKKLGRKDISVEKIARIVIASVRSSKGLPTIDKF